MRACARALREGGRQRPSEGGSKGGRSVVGEKFRGGGGTTEGEEGASESIRRSARARVCVCGTPPADDDGRRQPWIMLFSFQAQP